MLIIELNADHKLALLSLIELEQEFTQDMSFEIFRNNIQFQYATIRCFEIIGEAAKRITESFRFLHSQGEKIFPCHEEYSLPFPARGIVFSFILSSLFHT